MDCWHYNIAACIKNREFQKAIITTLGILEPDKDSNVIIAMLRNYFNLRNPDFGSNWIDLPTCGITLQLNKKGIYYEYTTGARYYARCNLNELNARIRLAITEGRWGITFPESEEVWDTTG